MIVKIAGALLRFTEYRSQIPIHAPTVGAGLAELATQYPALKSVLYDREGRVRATHRVCLNGEMLGAGGLMLAVREDDRVDILTAISGG